MVPGALYSTILYIDYKLPEDAGVYPFITWGKNDNIQYDDILAFKLCLTICSFNRFISMFLL